MNMFKKDKTTLIYILLMLAMGIWQLIDWYFGSEDPIWHLLFYLFFMPFLSLYYGLATGDRKNTWIIPLMSGSLSALIYIFIANGGFSVDSSALQLAAPSFIASAVGVIIRRIMLLISKRKGI